MKLYDRVVSQKIGEVWVIYPSLKLTAKTHENCCLESWKMNKFDLTFLLEWSLFRGHSFIFGGFNQTRSLHSDFV